jgi:ATP-dependent DNA helicase PIF1
MTIPLLHVSMKGIFEYGQAYVALSRATDLEGLLLTDYHPNVVRAHPQVKKFYQEMGYTRDAEHRYDSGVSTLSAS